MPKISFEFRLARNDLCSFSELDNLTRTWHLCQADLNNGIKTAKIVASDEVDSKQPATDSKDGAVADSKDTTAGECSSAPTEPAVRLDTKKGVYVASIKLGLEWLMREFATESEVGRRRHCTVTVQ